MEIGLVKKINLREEMQNAYLDYAMSVIVARALPDARDGLKPVHRRILYAMYDMGLRPDSTHKKSARIVGEVLGKYHPHGDMAVYDAMARMAQDFSMRYQLVDGQGNFGSIDGDSPAAMRYTEARLQAPALHMLDDIEKDTVDFDENFDGTLTEPTVLPAAIPNLLVNGATGIAVGMATSIPPHNLGEVIDGLQYLLTRWNKLDDVGVEDLMQFVHGPDFPTGGVIIQDPDGDSLASAYSTGRGKITVQARAHLEEMGRGRNRIIVTELPFMTNKSSLIARIADLARTEKLEGISDLRDESDREGMRIVIEVNKAADPKTVLADLYKRTLMQTTLSIIMLALVNSEPRLLSLKQLLKTYLDHRLEIVRRRSEFDLKKARERAHILEGLRVALQNMEEVIALIRRSADVETARSRLRKKYKLSVLQANAILDMPLRRLAALERKKIDLEYREIKKRIREIEALLRSPRKMRQLVSDELQAVKEKYADRRKTHIVKLSAKDSKRFVLTTTDLTPEKTVWISVTKDGLVSRTRENKMPRLSGKEAPGWIIRANTRDTLYLVTEKGTAAAFPMHAIPESDTTRDGAALTKVSALKEDDKLAALFALPVQKRKDTQPISLGDWYVLTITEQGLVKKSALSELPGASADTFTLVRVNKDDKLINLRLSSGGDEVLMGTAHGMAIRFSEAAVRPMGLVAAGVMGLKLQDGDEVVGMDLLPQAGEVFLISSDGHAKRVIPKQFPKQGRYGQGVVAWKLPGDARVVGMCVGKGTQKASLHLSRLLPKAIRLDDAPIQGRTARGKIIVDLKTGEQIKELTVPWDVPRPVLKKVKKRSSSSGSKK